MRDDGRGRQKSAAGVAEKLGQLDAEVIASVTLQEIVSRLMQDFEWMTVAEVTHMIGRMVEAEIGDRRGKTDRALTAKKERELVETLGGGVLESIGVGESDGEDALSRTAKATKKKRAKTAAEKQNVDRMKAKHRLYSIMNKPGSVTALDYDGGDAQNAPWSVVEAVHVGATILDLVMTSAYVKDGDSNFVPAFTHRLFYNRKHGKTIGKVVLDKAAQKILLEDQDTLRLFVKPKMQPMVVPPRPWLSQEEGPYLTAKTQLVRSHPSRLLDDALAGADFQGVLDGLNALSSCAWMVNGPLFHVANKLWEDKRPVAGLVSRLDEVAPKPAEFYDLEMYAEWLAERREWNDYVKETQAKFGKAKLDAKAKEVSYGSGDENSNQKVRVKGWVEYADDFDTSFQSKKLSAEQSEKLIDGVRSYRSARRKTKKKNREMFSIRANTGYELDQAATFCKEDRFYLPHNVDFRGRAYPIPGYLQHMRADLMRAMLTFAGPGIPLGERGVYWLKVHLANKLGSDKLSFDERVAVAEDAIPRALQAARDPLSEVNLEFWAGKDDPFQLLAACFEIDAAMGRRGNETSMRSFHSTLPVAMDGSCNGLQHYAALGRDSSGGLKVNLVPSDRPQDVYTGVAELVQKRVLDEAAAGNVHAQRLVGRVNRKVVKQTVMTSVYGVTLVGARLQLLGRLRDGGMDEDHSFPASLQLARWTMDALADMFSEARETMDWLSAAASHVARAGSEVQWLTPLGLPVVQPYRKVELSQIRTSMQRITVGDMGEHMPVASQQQTTAFSPNYVHSVDSSHMLMTAVACHGAGIQFASVHDSFWAHASNIDEMNRLLREKFLELHSRELLVELRDSIHLRHPKLKLPDLPVRGDLELERVLESPYFFS